MKIKIDKNSLINAINNVQKAISNKTTIEVHKDIYIETINETQIKLIGNDLNLGIETIIDAEIIENGKCTVNSRLFGEIIKKMPADVINLEKNNNTVKINANETKFNLKTGNTDEFITLPPIKQDAALEIDKYIFADMIRQTIFATSKDESRPILNGLLFNLTENKLTMVGLDLYRIAMKTYNIETQTNNKIVIPAKTLAELYKIISNDDDEEIVKIYITDKYIKLTYANVLIISRLLEGEYIDYQQAVPTEHQIRVKCSRQELYKAIDRASLIASQDNNKSLLFELDNDILNISTNSELGSVSEKIDIENNGKNLKIGFNTRYWLDILKVLDSDNVILEFTDNLHPCLVKPDDSELYSYVIFPVRIASQ